MYTIIYINGSIYYGIYIYYYIYKYIYLFTLFFVLLFLDFNYIPISFFLLVIIKG